MGRGSVSADLKKVEVVTRLPPMEPSVRCSGLPGLVLPHRECGEVGLDHAQTKQEG